ncbi:unnamed protein product [Wuchereria bancrofti]|uniref:Uncharacterized protein n=1 Tax=Wuchereria bancrofti TaxID=6293 RepID=A0A3P7EN09_WUCBA|nr:unnamed protein product [Wuchereria bancrofti]
MSNVQELTVSNVRAFSIQKEVIAGISWLEVGDMREFPERSDMREFPGWKWVIRGNFLVESE